MPYAAMVTRKHSIMQYLYSERKSWRGFSGWSSRALHTAGLREELFWLQVLKSGLHVALNSEDYVGGVRQSILAGGDTTSR